MSTKGRVYIYGSHHYTCFMVSLATRTTIFLKPPQQMANNRLRDGSRLSLNRLLAPSPSFDERTSASDGQIVLRTRPPCTGISTPPTSSIRARLHPRATDLLWHLFQGSEDTLIPRDARGQTAFCRGGRPTASCDCVEEVSFSRGRK